MTEGPRQPRRRAGNIRAAYLCPVCRESQAKLESHLTECFARFLEEVKEQTLSPPLPDLSEQFHPVFPVFLPPPPIPAAVAPEVDSERITRLSSLDLLLDHHVVLPSPLRLSLSLLFACAWHSLRREPLEFCFALGYIGWQSVRSGVLWAGHLPLLCGGNRLAQGPSVPVYCAGRGRWAPSYAWWTET